eukprot:6591084-Heterocapsa_arctica.AAC.1
MLRKLPSWTATPIAINSLSAVERVTTGWVQLHVPISVPRKNAQPPDVDCRLGPLAQFASA